MKKFKKILVALVAMVSVLVLASCTEVKKPKVEFLKSYIDLTLGQEVELNDETLLKIENAEFKDIHFVAKNQNVVFISPNNQIKTVGKGTTTIEATVKDSRSIITISVSVPLQPFAKVSEIVYNPATAEVSWNPPFVLVDGNEVVATGYEVKVTRNNMLFTDYEKISNTKYKFLQGGTYKVFVKAIVSGYAYSEEVSTTFTVLDTPTGLKFEKGGANTHLVKWNTVTGATLYQLKVNEEVYVVSQNSYTLNLENAGTYSISVKAIKSENEHSVYTNKLEVIKLEKPALKLENGILKVVLSQQEKLGHFALTIKAYQNEDDISNFTSTTGEFDLSSLQAGNYVAEVKAIAQSSALVISSEISETLAFEKLALPTISFDTVTKEVVVSGAEAGVKLFVLDMLTEKMEQFDFVDGKYAFNKPFGEFKLWAQNLATEDNVINSANSSEIIVKVLGFTKDIYHTISLVDNTLKSVISFQKVLGATNYQVKIDGVVFPAQVLNEIDNRISFVLDQNPNTVFALAKEYELEIVAIDQSYSNILIYGQPSNNKITITRLDAVEQISISLPVQTQPITWETPVGAVGYAYVLYKNFVLVDEGVLQTASFDVSALRFGSYKLELYTLGNQKEFLDSINYAEFEFSKQEQLSSPLLSFDRENQHILITEVENANAYRVYYEETLVATLTDTLNFDVSSFLLVEKQHDFYVVAINQQDNFENGGNLVPSQSASLSVTKLESVKRVIFENEQVFKYDNDLLLSVQNSNEYTLQIKTNNEVVNLAEIDISTLNEFSLSVTKIANQTYDNPYLISSEEFVLNFERLEKVKNLSFTNWQLAWDNISNADAYELTIKKDSFTEILIVTENAYNLEEVAFRNQLENGFSFTVKAIANQEYSENGQLQILSSVASEPRFVNVLAMPEIVNVEKIAQNQHKVIWTQIENVEFVVNFENTTQTISANEIVLVMDENKQEHILKLKAVSPNHISSLENVFIFEQVAQVEKVNVFENSTFEIDYTLTLNSYISVNGQKISIEDKINILNPEAINNGVYEFTIEVVAEFMHENVYYISSKISVVTFEKHQPVSNLRVESGYIKWQENPYATFYELVFENSLEETLSIVLPAKDSEENYVNSISLADQRIAEFVENSTLAYSLKIKVKISDYELENGNLGKIDSDLSESLSLSKLEQVKNVNVSLFDLADKEQKVLTISWDAVVGASYYNVYANNQLLLENQISTSVESDFFTFENSLLESGVLTGKFEVVIIAFGADKIASEKSEVLEFRRLDKVKGFKTTNNTGGLQWNVNSLSDDFVFYIENQQQELSEFIEISGVVSYNFESLLELEEFKDGLLKLYLLVSGDGDLTFSSSFEKIEVVRLDAPNFEILGDKIVAYESLIYEQAGFELVVYFKEEGQSELVEIEKINLSAGEFLLPTEWKYKNGTAITAQGTFVFEMVTAQTGYITSVKTTKEKVKLDSVVIEGFRKVSDATLLNEIAFEFLINVGNIAQTGQDENPALEITIAVRNSIDSSVFVFVDTTAQNRQGQIVYDMQELFLAMKGNFNVQVKVSAVGFIDSKIVTITGTRLVQNTSLRSKTGVLTWTRSLSSSASGYMLKVNYGSSEESQNESILIKQINDLAIVSDKLEGISGALTANVKILSNMPMNTIVNTNIVLDSFYMGQVETLEDESLIFEETPYNAVKLDALEDVEIKQGMFYFKKVGQEQAVEYVLIALDGEFQGIEYTLNIELQDEEYIQALSQMFYQGMYKLAKDKVYSFSIKALAVNTNGLDSDVGQTLKVKLLNTVSNLNVFWKEYETGETNRFDTVVISWSPAVEILNPQYIYSINASSVTEGAFNVVDINEYIIRSNNALNAKNHNFRIRVMGSSEETSEGYYYLTSEYSASITLTGLARPEVALEEGVFTWKPVPFAEGYYIYYMKKTSNEIITPNIFSQNKTWYSEFITTTSWKAPESFSDSLINQGYYIAVVAVNRDITRKYMPSAYGTVFILASDEDGNEIPNAFSQLIVLKAPDLFGNNDGVLMWHDMNYNISYFFGTPAGLNAGNNPFVYSADIESLFEIKVNVRIEDPSGRLLIKEFYAASLFYADIFDDPAFKTLAGSFGFDLNQKYGIGHIDEFINEIFPSIKAGNNFISAMQIGNDLDLLNSKYNDGKEYYIPQQVNTTISNSILSWNAIQLPTDIPYQNTTGKYIVISEDDEGKRIVVTKTNQLSINLLDFVNDDTLKPGNHKLYVIVAGDGDFYLNGIAAPYISTFVLPSVSANLNRGILYWDSMQNTSGYLVKALTGGEDYNFIQNMLVNSWDFKELRATDALGDNIEYHLTLQAVGNGRTIISGKETDFGTIIKLKTPNVNIVKGIFAWENIQNNLGYMINLSGDDNITFTIGTSITQYESIYKGFNAYNFRAVGSTTSVIGENTINYAISSYMDQALNAVMLQSVKGTNTYDGQIVWQAMTDYSNISINEYKLSFDQINFKPSVFLTNNDYVAEVIEGSTYILYQLLEGYGAGVYKVYLQAYSNGTFVKNEITYSYLLGEIDTEQSSTQFEKLQTVENIRVVNGVIHWDNPNSYDSSYRVTFIQGSQSFNFIANSNSFDATLLSETELELYDQILADLPVDVIVQVLGNDTNLINSDEVRINNFTKLKTITEIDYVTDENEEAGFIIRWYLPGNEVGLSNYEYVISYIDNPDTGIIKTLSSMDSDFIVKGYDNDRKLYYGEIDAAYLLDRNSSTLIYKVAVMPVTNSNFISSSFSLPRSVSPPESLSGQFLFDTASQKISWAYEREGSDVIFRIVDELVELDQNNEVAVIKTNVYLSQEKQFFPKEIGLHRIKIAVVLGTGKVSSSYVYFYHQGVHQGLINSTEFEVISPIETQSFTLLDFNLFESGEGSEANPYVISTENHFNNVRYRNEKPTYLEQENRFTFVQANDLIINSITNGIQNFAGNYDGQGFAISYHLISSKTTTSQDVALFESIASIGQIKNLVINAKITLNHSASVSAVRLSALSITNSGLIENVLIKTFELVSNITNTQVRYTYGAVAVQNNGTIDTVVSKANITFVGGQGHQSMLNADITIGGLVENNAGAIINSGSYANFKVTARRVTIAGVAVVSQINATITRAFNQGNIDVAFNANNSSDSYIAGLVGRNLGIVSSSYSSASSIKVDLMGTSNRVYIGGLAGLIQGANGSLINNSFTLTTDISLVNSGSSTADVGLMIGRTTAQDNNAQVRSYYRPNPSLSILNGTNATFKTQSISTMAVLLNQLNGQEENAFRIVGEIISHVWQQNFELI